MRFFYFLLHLPRGAGARAHLEKTGVREEGIANFACRTFSRGTKKTTNYDGHLSNKRPENSSKNEGGNTCEKPSKIIQTSPKMHPKTSKKRPTKRTKNNTQKTTTNLKKSRPKASKWELTCV